jgi:hypothetical protein
MVKSIVLFINHFGRTGYRYEEKIANDEIYLGVDIRCRNEQLTYTHNSSTLSITQDYIALGLPSQGNQINNKKIIFPASITKVEFKQLKTDKEKDEMNDNYKKKIGYVHSDYNLE